MTSQIDITKPIFGTPTTQSVRDNFTTAHNEITTLQNQVVGSPFLSLAGDRMLGPMYLFNDPTDAMMPATKGYVDANAGVGGGGLPEAPADGVHYGRFNGSWSPVLPIAGGGLLGPLILAADPTNVLGATTKQYVDALAASKLTDAPNDASTYGRQANAWVGVLPIIGGRVTGSVSVGTVVIPGDVSVPTLFSNAETFPLNAGVSWNVYGATGANPYKYLAAGYAGTRVADGGNSAKLYLESAGAHLLGNVVRRVGRGGASAGRCRRRPARGRGRGCRA